MYTHTQSKVSLVEDSPDHCKEAGIRPLPELPQMELSIHHHLLPQLFFVSEFLFIFADAFNLRRRLEGRELCRLLAGGRGLGEVYLRLLKVRVGDCVFRAQSCHQEFFIFNVGTPRRGGN